ncbi:MAG: Gfo/Idh/MocA family oxidoreductase [Anaerolineae bacterium]|nr:Gfo/Idh/MocA family oxidoreductase [Anaerolineae bacterium]
MKFLIAGFGSIGRRHFRNLAALGENDIVLLRTHRSTLDDDEIHGVPAESTIEAALKHWPDAVIIANPTANHLAVAIPAAQAGCHILVEKPVSDTLDGIDDLRSALAHHQRQLLVGFQFRYHPGLRRVKELLDRNVIGRPLLARAHWGEYLPDWHPWEDYRGSYAARKDLGGGVVRTLSHPLDYLRWLMGDVEQVKAITGNFSDLELSDVEDMGEIQLRFLNGAFGSLNVNYFQRPARHDLEIVGTKGTIRWDNADGACRWWTDNAGWQVHPLPTGFDRNDLFLAEMQHFIAIIRGEVIPLCGLEDGLAVQSLIQQALAPAQ